MGAVTDTAQPTQGVDSLAAINAIRGLSIDMVEAANSGHPGLPLGMAPAAYVLYARVMTHNPADPAWPDRDRFVLSAGHGSALLYSVLHLSGYSLPLEELRRFRQLGSVTAGHPEHGTPGVETSTGPLGQGFANGVGMAMAERFLRERYGADLIDHRTYGICSDGDLMEGISAEAASLAGHLGLGRITYLYDDNQITIDGSTDLSFTGEDVEARFRAYGWHTASVSDANDIEAIEAAIAVAGAEEERPSLIRVRSVIGWPAPNKSGTSGAHGSPLGEEEARATKELLGLDPDATFAISDEAREGFADARSRGAEASGAWRGRIEDWRSREPGKAAEWDAAWAGKPLPAEPSEGEPEADPVATRAAVASAMQAFASRVPTMVGGAADLVGSTGTEFKGEASFSREHAGRNVNWGIREHAMAASVNGLALHGGIVKPYGSTFLVFSDYMRPSIRLSALMGIPVVWVFTHDSVAVGEDGPTHQPIEQIAALRAIPGLTVIRPADAAESAEAWRVTLEEIDGPVCLILTRQKLPALEQGDVAEVGDLAKGAYTLAEPEGGNEAGGAEVVLVASGSEVSVAVQAQKILGSEQIRARVVSMPSWELFASQPKAYRDSVLPPELPKVSVEAGTAMGWSQWVDASVAIDRFGESGPGGDVLEHLGITAERTASVARELLSSA
ncbi:transketolase [soil metagenome]